MSTLKGKRERMGPPTLWYLGNVDGLQCHANQVVPANGLVDDAMTPARKKGIVGQAGKPELLPCRGNGFRAIRRRLTHGRVRYIVVADRNGNRSTVALRDAHPGGPRSLCSRPKTMPALLILAQSVFARSSRTHLRTIRDQDVRSLVSSSRIHRQT